MRSLPEAGSGRGATTPGFFSGYVLSSVLFLFVLFLPLLCP